MAAVLRFGAGVATAFRTGMAEVGRRAQFLREKDFLVAGVQAAGFTAIASVVSLAFPVNWTTRLALAGTSLAYAKFLGGEAGARKVFFQYFREALLLTRSCCKSVPEQNKDNGAWIGSDRRVCWSQFFNSGLAQGISDWCRDTGIQSVWDFGCGQDDYSKFLVKHNAIIASGLDGNPETVALSRGSAQECDLTEPCQLEERDCVMSLEVGDKIPAGKMDIFLNNLTTPARKRVILSWAELGQKGPCHLNLQSKEAIIAKMKERGWEVDDVETERLRRSASPIFYWHKNVIVYKKAGLHVE